MGWKESFSFIALILAYARARITHTHTWFPAESSFAYPRGVQCFSFRGYSPFLKLGKKGRVPPVLRVHHIELLRHPFHLFLSTELVLFIRLPLVVCEKNSSLLVERKLERYGIKLRCNTKSFFHTDLYVIINKIPFTIENVRHKRKINVLLKNNSTFA